MPTHFKENVMNSSEWLSKLLGLVETYAAARMAPGGGVVNANLSTFAALTDIVQHAAAHPAMSNPPPAPTPERAGGAGEE